MAIPVSSPIKDAPRDVTMGDIDDVLNQGKRGVYTTDPELVLSLRKFHEILMHKEGIRYYLLSKDAFARYKAGGGKWAYAD